MEAIIAVNKKNIIGNENTIPWYVPEDLQYFRKTTEQQIVVMGRKTFESLPKGPLPKRINIVLTKEPEKFKHLETKYKDKQLLFKSANDFTLTWENIKNKYPNKKWFVIGGSEIYNYFFPNYNKVHLTFIMNDEDGDTISPFSIERLKEHGLYITHRGLVQESKNNTQFQHIIYEKS